MRIFVILICITAGFYGCVPTIEDKMHAIAADEAQDALQSIKYKISDLESRIEALESEIENLRSTSHYH